MFAATSLPRAPTAGVAQATRAPGVIALLLGIALAVCAVQPVRAAAAPQPQERSQDPIRNMDALSVVLLRAVTPKDAASAATLGAQREGSGIVIDSSGLILTIGYLIVEAEGIEVVPADGKAVPASLVGYDHATGFGLVRTTLPLPIRPIEFGDSSDLRERDPVLIAGFDGVAPAFVVSKRQFAGYWEYLLDSAIFTAPATVNWSGAALIGRDGKLYGVGSLIVTDAVKPQTYSPGNMFVPIDLLKPILGDLIGGGKVSGPARPWIGVNTQEMQGHLVITRVTREGPAEKGGLKAGDIILRIGDDEIKGQVDFYRKLWAKGPAGTDIPLSVLQGAQTKEILIRSIDRTQHLRARTTY